MIVIQFRISVTDHSIDCELDWKFQLLYIIHLIVIRFEISITDHSIDCAASEFSLSHSCTLPPASLFAISWKYVLELQCRYWCHQSPPKLLRQYHQVVLCHPYVYELVFASNQPNPQISKVNISILPGSYLVSPLLDLSLGGCGATVWKAKARVTREREMRVKRVRVRALTVWWRAARGGSGIWEGSGFGLKAVGICWGG